LWIGLQDLETPVLAKAFEAGFRVGGLVTPLTRPDGIRGFFASAICGGFYLKEN
jgi:hypothetical protein